MYRRLPGRVFAFQDANLGRTPGPGPEIGSGSPRAIDPAVLHFVAAWNKDRLVAIPKYHPVHEPHVVATAPQAHISPH